MKNACGRNGGRGEGRARGNLGLIGPCIPHTRVSEGWLVSIMDGILNRSAEDVGDLVIPGFIKQDGTRAAKETAGRQGPKS